MAEFGYFSGKCRVYAAHHQATAIKVHVTAGLLLRQAESVSIFKSKGGVKGQRMKDVLLIRFG